MTGSTALRLGENGMRQAFFDDQPKSEPVPNLGQQIRDNDRLARSGHPKQDAMLRRVSESGPDPDQITLWRHCKLLRPLPGAR